jgi:hypothetical protein
MWLGMPSDGDVQNTRCFWHCFSTSGTQSTGREFTGGSLLLLLLSWSLLLLAEFLAEVLPRPRVFAVRVDGLLAKPREVVLLSTAIMLQENGKPYVEELCNSFVAAKEQMSPIEATGLERQFDDATLKKQ